MWLFLSACAFVEPPVAPVVLEPGPEAMRTIDQARARHLATDAGAEFWRAIDAHGGMLRWELLGAPTATTADGRSIGPDDPLYGLVALPFAHLPDEATQVDIDTDEVRVQIGGDTLHLDPTRHLQRVTRDGEVWTVNATRLERLWLPTTLTSDEGQVIELRWAFP